jgi:hypothetical protein
VKTLSLPTHPSNDLERHAFVLQTVQPALLGLMDGSVSTLAPIFAAAGLTGRPLSAFFVGLAASLGAAISMGLSEALSDDGEVTGRGSPLQRGAITGIATGVGGMLHTVPFLSPNLNRPQARLCGRCLRTDRHRLHPLPLDGRSAGQHCRSDRDRRSDCVPDRALAGSDRGGLIDTNSTYRVWRPRG